MALIRFAEGQQRSGKLGGSVYSHNAAGQYIRACAVPTNPSTTLQAAVRDKFAELVHRWTNVLSPAQRAAWITFGKNVTLPNRLGDVITIGGNNWYFGYNTPRLQAGLAVVDDGPIIFAGADSPSTFTPTGTVDDQKVSVAYNNADAWATETGGALLIYQGLPHNASRSFYKGPYRYLGKVLGNTSTPPTSPASFNASYAIALGAQTRLYCRATLADGRLSSMLQASFLGAAT